MIVTVVEVVVKDLVAAILFVLFWPILQRYLSKILSKYGLSEGKIKVIIPIAFWLVVSIFAIDIVVRLIAVNR